MHPKTENLWKDKTNTGALIRDPGPFHALQLWEFPRMPFAGSPVPEKNPSRKPAEQKPIGLGPNADRINLLSNSPLGAALCWPFLRVR
jgi:hypothetical protein